MMTPADQYFWANWSDLSRPVWGQLTWDWDDNNNNSNGSQAPVIQMANKCTHEYQHTHTWTWKLTQGCSSRNGWIVHWLGNKW